MSKHAPLHRAPSRRRPGSRLFRHTVIAAGLAVAVTGISVSGGLISSSGAGPEQASEHLRVASSGTSVSRDTPERTDEVTLADLEDRSEEEVSRADRRDRREAPRASVESRPKDSPPADPREIGRALLEEFGFAADEYECLDALYVSESDWRVDADNPTSSAYGIPQALTELHDLPVDYMTSAESQIRWGLQYISDSYGTPCSAWGFKQGNGWY